MTQTPSVYTAHDIPDLLNTVPTLFGFWPQESLVAVATRGPRRRFGFRMRVDIPARESVQDLAGIVVGHLANQGAEGAILIAVTQQQEIARDLLAAIERQLPPITVIVAARADGERYWSDEPGFPTEGIAYETSDHHLAVVQASPRANRSCRTVRPWSTGSPRCRTHVGRGWSAPPTRSCVRWSRSSPVRPTAT